MAVGCGFQSHPLTRDLILQFNVGYFPPGRYPHTSSPVWGVQLPVGCPDGQYSSETMVRLELKRMDVRHESTKMVFRESVRVVSVVRVGLGATAL